jgi:multiple sugar transport system substrate-binding protein
VVRALSVVALAIVAAACGGRDAPAPVRLQVFGDPLEIGAYRELLAAYHARHPDARVELTPVGKQKDHMARLVTAFAAGDPPDVFVLNFRRFGQLAAKGVLAELGPALTATGQWREADFYEPAVEAFRYEGKLLCLPQNVSSLVVYYNRALFRAANVALPAADWTVGDFMMAALNLRRRAKDANGGSVWGVGVEPSLIRLAPFIWTYGGSLVDDTQRPTRITLDQPAALQLFKALRGGRMAPTLASYKSEDHEARFARGDMGMLLQSRRLTATLRQTPGLDWDVAPFPRAREPVGVLHADGYCQAAAARDPVAARRFIEFALSEEGQAVLTRSGRLVPARESVAESPVFLDPTQPPASARIFLDAIPRLRRTPNTATWHEVESRADILIEEWFYEAPVGGEEEGGDGISAAQQFAARLRSELQQVLAGRP